MASSTYLEEQLRIVSNAFLSHLNKKISQIDEVWSILNQNTVADSTLLQRLSDIAHELHGQGTFFGYPKVTQCAGIIEEILEMIIKREAELSTEARHTISDHIEKIRESAATDKASNDLFGNDLDALRDLARSPSAGANQTPARCILLIDDANVMRQKIALALRQTGFEVLEARDGATGITLALQRTPDLILLDIKMPEIDGFEVQRTIRTNDDLTHVPIVFLTSLSRVSIAQIQDALSYGISDFISKPFKMSRLIEKVQSVLDNS